MSRRSALRRRRGWFLLGRGGRRSDRLDRLGGLGGWPVRGWGFGRWCRLLLLGGALLHPPLELARGPADRARELGELLRAEQQHHDPEDDQPLRTHRISHSGAP